MQEQSLYEHISHNFKDDLKKNVAFQFEKRIDGKKVMQEWDWETVSGKVKNLSLFFLEKKLKVQDKIGIFSQNKPEWSIVDFACLESRICSVPIYPTTSEEHLIHIINDAEIKMIFVGDEEQFLKINNVKDSCPTLVDIICLYGEEFEDLTEDFKTTNELIEERIKRIERIKSKDLVTLIYTSGTTGMPKGVMLDNTNFHAAVLSHKERIKINKDDLSMCFLPLSHIFERAWTYYVLSCEGTVFYLDNPADVANALRKVKPTVMCSVPRFFEKVYTRVQSDLDKASSSKRKIFKWASRIGRKVFSRKMNKEIVGPFLYMQYMIANKLVFSKFKESFGGRIRFFNCGGASLQDDVNMFFQSLAIPIIYGYGMTETLATVSCYTKIPAIGSVGKAMPNVEVRIDPKTNEIQVKGDTITKGYYNLPEANEDLFTKDGWLKTGDAGRMDAEGNIYYTERIKDLMKTSNGKYVAPQNVESTLLKDKFIDQVAVIAEGKTFVSALIVPDYQALEDYANEKAIEFKNKKELLSHTNIHEMLEERIKAIQGQLNNFEKVKKFKLLEKPFSVLENEITPTLKIKRKVVAEKYKQIIDELYHKKEKNKDSDDNK